MRLDSYGIYHSYVIIMIMIVITIVRLQTIYYLFHINSKNSLQQRTA